MHTGCWIDDQAWTSLLYVSVCFILQLRNAMVNRRTGAFSMEVKKTVDRGVRRQINMFSVSLKR